MSKGKKLNYNEEKNKGITLITLVITIIVLIILATVSIGILGGENGIIKKSKYAKEQTEIAEEIDILKLCTALAMGEDPDGNVTESNLRNELDKNVKNYTIESKADKFKVTFESGRAYIVDVNGNVSENAEGWDDIQVANPKVTYNYNGATSGNGETEKQLTYGSTYGILPKPGKTITVTYEYNGATGGNAKRVDTSTFTFGGWYKENNFKNQVIESTQVTTTSNHTLYAKWTGGGITLPTPTKNGYTFECWCTDSGLSNSVGTGGSIYNANSNITLYAKWTQNPIITYTVTYNKNTQDVVENIPSNQIKTQGVNLKLSDLVPTRAGYTFKGWSTNISQTETGEYQAGATYSQDANLKLYAVWKKAGSSSIEIAGKATEYYGQIVENYNAKYDDNGTTWRIFMADESNIYLIADDYMHYNYAPEKNNVPITNHSYYILSFDNVYSQYSGASNIESAFGSKWLSTYWKNGGSSSTYSNIKAVAYMLDKEIWNGKYKTGYESVVDYAIGGPTLEMYCKSYKDTHPSKYIECASATSTGYQVKWKGGSYEYSISGVPQDEFNRIYIKSSTSKAPSMWLASPSAYISNVVMSVGYNGKVSYTTYSIDHPGLCPLVCLQSNIQLEKNPNTGNYRIVQ